MKFFPKLATLFDLKLQFSKSLMHALKIPKLKFLKFMNLLISTEKIYMKQNNASLS